VVVLGHGLAALLPSALVLGGMVALRKRGRWIGAVVMGWCEAIWGHGDK
jgi:hypothetical protein